MTTAAAVLDVARGYLGLAEQPPGSNHVPGITDWYGIDGAWCAMFQSRVFFDAGMPLAASTPKGFAWVSAGFEWMARQPGWVLFTDPRQAAPGDLIAWEWGSTAGGYDHISLVESVGPGGLTTIGGNERDHVNEAFLGWPSGIALLARPPYTDTTTQEDPPMPAPSILVQEPDADAVWECFTGSAERRLVNDPNELNVFRVLGTPFLDASTPADTRWFWLHARVPVGGGTDAGAIVDALTRTLPAEVAREVGAELARRLAG